MKNENQKVVTAEMLMQQVEELLLMNQISEEEKVKILRKVLENLGKE
jgi:hypothetical protein